MNLTSKLRTSYWRGIVEGLLVSNALHRLRSSRLLFRATMSTNGYKCESNVDTSRSYEEALKCLNELQSNLSAFTMATSQVHQSDNTSKADAQKYLQNSGITMEQLDTLSVIHVSGTKGKGSTCALVESILRATGLRTGFYSSPHLVDVTERFRLDGKPISRRKFAKYFWRVYEALDASKTHDLDMPAYFKFLTVMAFHVFLGAKVDVAILEVGIGGEHDCTNIVRNTKTAGITALGLDHTQLLGNTLSDIAWQKSGIIKTGCNVFASNQPLECHETLRSRTREKCANLQWVPDLTAYNWNDNPLINLSPAYRLNGSLAIQLAYDWIKNNPSKINNSKIVEELNRNENELCFSIFDEVRTGFQQCHWPGRFQIVRLGSKNLYIDGSHTTESLEICIEWFKEQTKLSNFKNNYLIFNLTGGRDYSQMLSILHSSQSFAMAAFVPNVARSTNTQTNGSTMKVQTQNAINWDELERKHGSKDDTRSSSRVFASVEDVFKYLDHHHKSMHNGGDANSDINVLITGSLYLVGAVTELLNENYK